MKTDGLYDVLAVGQDVLGDCPGKHRVTLEYGQAVPYALAAFCSKTAKTAARSKSSPSFRAVIGLSLIHI